MTIGKDLGNHDVYGDQIAAMTNKTAAEALLAKSSFPIQRHLGNMIVRRWSDSTEASEGFNYNFSRRINSIIIPLTLMLFIKQIHNI